MLQAVFSRNTKAQVRPVQQKCVTGSHKLQDTGRDDRGQPNMRDAACFVLQLPRHLFRPGAVPQTQSGVRVKCVARSSSIQANVFRLRRCTKRANGAIESKRKGGCGTGRLKAHHLKWARVVAETRFS